jgi:Myb/SANT-like DNA-binding domain
MEARACWDTAQHHHLVDGLLQALRAGKASENGFKREAWKEIKVEFNAVFGTSYSIPQLKTAWKELKTKYAVVKRLQEQSGFGWNPVLQKVTAELEVWNAYVASNQEAKEFRTKPFPFFDKIHILVDGKIATGNNAFSTLQQSREGILPLNMLIYSGIICTISTYRR